MSDKNENIDDAVKYALASNGLENLHLTHDEVKQIVNDLQNGRSDGSLLYSIVKAVYHIDDEPKETEENHGLSKRL